MASASTQASCRPYDLLFGRDYCVETEKDHYYTDFVIRYWAGYVLSSLFVTFAVYCTVVFAKYRTLRWRLLHLFLFGLMYLTKRVYAPTVLSCCYNFYYLELTETACFYGFKTITSLLVLFGVMLTGSLLESTIHLYANSPLAERSFYFGVGFIFSLLIYPFTLHFDLYMSAYDAALSVLLSAGTTHINIAGSVLFVVSIVLFFLYCYWFLRAVIYFSNRKYAYSFLNGLYIPATAINLYSLGLTFYCGFDATAGICYFLYREIGAVLLAFIYWWYLQSGRTVYTLFQHSETDLWPILEENSAVVERAPQCCRKAFFTLIFHRVSKRLSRQNISRPAKREIISLMRSHILPDASINSFTAKNRFHSLNALIEDPDVDLFLALHRFAVGYRVPLRGGRTFIEVLHERTTSVSDPPSKEDQIWLAIHAYLSKYRNNSLFLLFLYDRRLSSHSRLSSDLLPEVISYLD